ncbi:MAG: hypothetical protein PF518_01560 [Spirochaetaceae bacterium]|jgi:hypothetical protein|nr:hypothetical protein [Spirochaetaceae bacterium]
MARKKLVFSIAGGTLLLLVVASVIFIGITKQKIEMQVTDQLDQAILQAQLEDVVSYETINISSLQGQLEINGIKYDDDIYLLTADSIIVEMPVKEILSLAKNPENTEITDVSIQLKGLNFVDESQNLTFNQDEWTMMFLGNIHTGLFSERRDEILTEYDPGISMISIESSGSRFMTPMGDMSLGNFQFESKGDLKLSNVELADSSGDYSSLYTSLESVSFIFSDYAFVLVDEIRDELLMRVSMLFGPLPFLEDPENWKIEEFALSGGITQGQAEVRDVTLKTNWIDIHANTSIGVSDNLEPIPPLDIQVSVNEYTESLRSLFEMMAYQLAESELPEGKSFTFNFTISDVDSVPKIVIK